MPDERRRAARDVVTSDLDAILDDLGSAIDQMAGTRMLITGGAGFLGHYLVQLPLRYNERLGRERMHVTVCDNFARGVPDWLRERQGRDDLTVVAHDITRPLPAAAGDFDWVIHAASIASPTYYRRFPIETMDANVGGLRLLLDMAQEQGARGRPVRGFLFFSTSEIYGDPPAEWIPTPEHYRGNVSCTGPRACYDESKRYGETLCVNFAQQRGITTRIARPFNNYGPGLALADGRVIPDFARDVLAGRDIVLLSDGAPTRTFCYVADAVSGYFRLLLKGRDGESYNIGTETPEVSMLELAERVAALGRELFGYEGRVVHGTSADRDYLTDNPNRRRPVIDKARRELGYDPRVSLDEGLRRSLIWYAGQQDVPAPDLSTEGATA